MTSLLYAKEVEIKATNIVTNQPNEEEQEEEENDEEDIDLRRPGIVLGVIIFCNSRTKLLLYGVNPSVLICSFLVGMSPYRPRS